MRSGLESYISVLRCRRIVVIKASIIKGRFCHNTLFPSKPSWPRGLAIICLDQILAIIQISGLLLPSSAALLLLLLKLWLLLLFRCTSFHFGQLALLLLVLPIDKTTSIHIKV